MNVITDEGSVCVNHYKTGQETKEKIFRAAKQCFYLHGYKKTTISMIAALADVPQSLITYYFKKEQFLLQIYEDYLNQVFHEIDRQVGHLLENHLQRHLLFMQIQYLQIYSDANSYAVYRYMIDNNLLSPNVFHTVDTPLMDCIREFGIRLDAATFRVYISAQYGAHRELIRIYLKEYDPQKSRPLFYFTGTIALRLAGVKQSVIEENIRKADALLEQMDLSQIHFLQ